MWERGAWGLVMQHEASHLMASVFSVKEGQGVISETQDVGVEGWGDCKVEES